MSPNGRLIAQNKRARFDYNILETVEAGIVLTGSEVKSIRLGRASIGESHAGPMEGELYLFNANVQEYNMTHHFNHEAKRPRKLLLRTKQLKKWLGSVAKKGMTIVPLSMYFNKKGIIKLDIALAKGKNVIDKRATIKERDWQREKDRVLKGNRGE